VVKDHGIVRFESVRPEIKDLDFIEAGGALFIVGDSGCGIQFELGEGENYGDVLGILLEFGSEELLAEALAGKA
jgi:hypothetical protein